MPSRRQERVNSRLVQEISAILRTLKDDRLGFITVVSSEVSPDMRHANIFVSVLGEDDEVERTMEILRAATGLIRKLLGKVMQMKTTPEIQFRRERGILAADEMSQLIAQARATDPNPGPLPEAGPLPEPDPLPEAGSLPEPGSLSQDNPRRGAENQPLDDFPIEDDDDDCENDLEDDEE